MEIELKYMIEDNSLKERILEDAHLESIKDSDSYEELNMRAAYFDTEDRDLQKMSMAFRVRYEGENIVSTFKWGGGVENGLHVRGELNVPVSEEFFTEPDVDVFKGSEIYDDIAKAVGDKKLVSVMEMVYVRKQMRLDTGKSISVISLDEGEIITEKGNAPILELELELYSGSQEDMVELGNEIAAKYNLQAGEHSKFKRGLMLLGEA